MKTAFDEAVLHALALESDVVPCDQENVTRGTSPGPFVRVDSRTSQIGVRPRIKYPPWGSDDEESGLEELDEVDVPSRTQPRREESLSNAPALLVHEAAATDEEEPPSFADGYFPPGIRAHIRDGVVDVLQDVQVRLP